MPENTSISVIGKDQPRIDGPLKVSGGAMYASDFHFPGLLYAVPVEATIANGKIKKLDTTAAEKMPGVRAIFHRGNGVRVRELPIKIEDLLTSSILA
jgi:xanthine dehydrogenase YagR molybdenum-binding subunit